MSNKSKIIMGLVGAAAAGVVVGLLLAPERGSDTRQKLKDTAEDWAEQLTDLFANAKGEIEKLSTKGAKLAEEASNMYKNKKESYS